MTMRERSREAVLADRDAIEEQLAGPVNAALQRYLRRVLLACKLPAAITAAAAEPEWPTLGEMSGWWAAEVDAGIVAAVRDAWSSAYGLASTGEVTASSMAEVPTFMAKVRDRLVRGLVPPVGEDSFDQVRTAVTMGANLGWSRKQTAERIAAQLDWTTNRDYWDNQKAQADRQIDALLDQLGPPGHPAREYARINDPRVKALRADRNSAIAKLDADESYWQVRATRIARTEATGANNYAAITALRDEGWAAKEWMAAHDRRTREEHVEADGQTVALDNPFMVGGYALHMPGDPSGPAHLVINCRCCVLGSDDLPAEVPKPAAPAEPVPPPADTSNLDPSWLSDSELEDELGGLMADPDGFDNPRLDALAREMDRRDAKLAALERQARERAEATAEQAAQLQEAEAAREQAFSEGRVLRRDKGRSDRAIRDEYETWIEVQYRAAEAELRGHLLSHRGKVEAINPRDLFTKQKRSLNLWASEELQEWFARHPRMSFPEFRAGALDDTGGRAARGRFKNRGWESEFG